jgi:uncharacterized repeat protein (TIGR03803 family)
VIFDSAGNLYGTTYSGGTNENGAVFELSPKGKKWKEKVLYSFASGSNQGRPQGRMLGRGGQQQLSCPVIEADASLRKIKALNGVEKANFLFCGRNKDSGSVGAIDSMTMSAPVPE